MDPWIIVSVLFIILTLILAVAAVRLDDDRRRAARRITRLNKQLAEVYEPGKVADDS